MSGDQPQGTRQGVDLFKRSTDDREMRRRTDPPEWNALPESVKTAMRRGAGMYVCSCCGEPGATAMAVYNAYRKAITGDKRP